MSALTYLSSQPQEVLEALQRGQITAIDTAIEQLPDYFVLYAIESGLLDGLATSFPDPRQEPQIPMRILLAAGMAAHFAGLYALSQSPYALHSPRLLQALGVQIAVNQPGQGLSRRGTKQASCYHFDVLRKLLAQIARLDRRAKRLPGQFLLDWYNQQVGQQFRLVAGAEPMVHILDCTKLTVTLDNDRYELSGVTTEDPKQPQRGYKLATLRSLLDQGALLTQIAWGPIEQHDLPLTQELVRTCPHLHPGDLLLQDRAFVDAATLSFLKLERQVEVCMPLKQDMNLFKAAIVQANADKGAWQVHPTRPNQQIQLVSGLGKSLWEGLQVDLNVCVIRKKNKRTGQFEYIGIATTDLSLSAKQIIHSYQTRPEIEEDYRQLKSTSWHLERFCATNLVQILWHVVLTLLAYNLFQLYANTDKGRAWAGKTKHKIEREHRTDNTTYLLVCTQTSFGLYETKALLFVLLDLPDDVRQKIRSLLPRSFG